MLGLFYKPRGEHTSAKLAQPGEMVDPEECGLAMYGRAGITTRAAGSALPWLALVLVGVCSEITVRSQLTCATRTGQSASDMVKTLGLHAQEDKSNFLHASV